MVINNINHILPYKRTACFGNWKQNAQITVVKYSLHSIVNEKLLEVFFHNFS